MIVVSQNKKSIYNFDNVKSIDILGNEIYISDDILSDMGACIANYETEERAKEVLKEIIKKYRDVTVVCDINNKKYEKYDLPKVYEMPKE